ncbi:glyoxal oxidase precursor [Dendrothele bispora CBS 962.96]|uniref:Glyoxal oxidase n=1 Tax=Dendrothele bispora (strain CBS 962.96) TaxID=1314807 RepID=A0A4S8MPU7_DENBC|nr:glyoxal oxidase precursor [Dendrothele bispora CBS 962.96]
MWSSSIFSRLAVIGAISTTLASPSPVSLGWYFVQNGTSGIVALEAIVLTETLMLIFDRPLGDPLKINGHDAWGGLWNLETNQVTALDMKSNSFCGSGGFLSNGTMVSTGGDNVELPPNQTIPTEGDGRMAIRMWEPCDDPTGLSCSLLENNETLHLAKRRWYSTSTRIFDGSLMVIGGSNNQSSFWNTPDLAENSIEFWPSKDGGVPRPSEFLERTIPVNLFPRVFALPDGKVFVVANNQSMIYDIETNTETPLPDLPNGVRVTNPFDGSATLLPLSPPDFVPEVLVCGGTNTSDQLDLDFHTFSSQHPATEQCSRIKLTPEGIEQGWEVELMPEGHIMNELILMPDGKVMIINGGQSGYAAYGTVMDVVSNSNADHPNFKPLLYSPDAPIGSRFTREGLPATDIPRLYHSSVTLTPSGNIFIGGSNPHGGEVLDGEFPSEYRIEYLNPPYMTVSRPALTNFPERVNFNQRFSADVDIPGNLDISSVQVALMDLGFSTHSFHASSRLVFAEAKLSRDKKSIEVLAPPNNRVYPPGPAWMFLTVDGVSSTGKKILVGSGEAPPVADQGVPL